MHVFFQPKGRIQVNPDKNVLQAFILLGDTISYEDINVSWLGTNVVLNPLLYMGSQK